MIKHSKYTMFWYQKSISDTRAKKLASLNIPTLDVSMVENLSNAQSRFLSQFKGSEIDLSWVESITDEQAFFLSHFKWDKLMLTGLEYITDTQAYYLANFRWSTLVLNGLKRISSTQARCLSYFWWDFLNLWWLTSLTVIQAKYLSEFEWDILYLDRVVDITEWGLAHFLHFGWTCLHIAGIQFEKGKPVITHSKSLSNWQTHLIAHYKYMNKVIFTNPIKLTDAQKHILELNRMDYKFTSFNIPLWWYLKYRNNDIIENEEKEINLEDIPTNLIAHKKGKKPEPVYYDVDPKYATEKPYEKSKYFNTVKEFAKDNIYIIKDDEILWKYKNLCKKSLNKEKSKNKKRERLKFLIHNDPNEVITISNEKRAIFLQYLAFIALMWAALSISIKSIMESL